MRGQPALGSPGHDDAGLIGVAVFAMRPQRVLQGAGREAAREIIDETVALGLAEYGYDAVRVDRPGFHRRLETGNVVGRLHGQPMDERLTRHGRLAITAFESA